MTPGLSIVLAAHGEPARTREVLAALRSQRRGDEELLLCHAAGSAAAVDPGEDWVTPVEGSAGALVPELWRDGIRRARAPRVALCVVDCRPGPRWLASLRAADLDRYAGVGGAIENDPASDARGWAIYLQRYLRYAPPFAFRETGDLPGDNVVYDRAALLAHADAFAEGFWEPEIHVRLLREGRRLALDPDLRVIHANGYGSREFARARLAHGRRFGRQRALALPRAGRFVYAALAPGIPVVFFAKIVREARRHPEALRHLLRATPHLLLFLCAWALGEARGAIAAALGPYR